MYKRLAASELKQFKCSNIIQESDLISVRRGNFSVGLCCGTFDFFHPGHILHLKSAKKFCDILVVGVSSDKQVSMRKGSNRPIFQQELRMFQVANIMLPKLYVVLNNYPTAVNLINELKPNVYIKGKEYMKKDTEGITRERDAIFSLGGEMRYTTDVTLSSREILDYLYRSMNNVNVLGRK